MATAFHVYLIVTVVVAGGSLIGAGCFIYEWSLNRASSSPSDARGPARNALRCLVVVTLAEVWPFLAIVGLYELVVALRRDAYGTQSA